MTSEIPTLTLNPAVLSMSSSPLFNVKRKLNDRDDVPTSSRRTKKVVTDNKSTKERERAAKREARMERNRHAAQVSRDRKKLERLELESRVAELESLLVNENGNRDQVQRLKALEEENDRLKDQLAFERARLDNVQSQLDSLLQLYHSNSPAPIGLLTPSPSDPSTPATSLQYSFTSPSSEELGSFYEQLPQLNENRLVAREVSLPRISNGPQLFKTLTSRSLPTMSAILTYHSTSRIRLPRFRLSKRWRHRIFLRLKR